MNWNREDLTPEERERVAGSQMYLDGFYCIIVRRLLQEPRVKTELHKPPDEEIPPSPYIPLAHR
jgi:hypothetical protein